MQEFEQAMKWQGRLDSNQRMAGSKPAALPLGDTPMYSVAVYMLGSMYCISEARNLLLI